MMLESRFHRLDAFLARIRMLIEVGGQVGAQGLERFAALKEGRKAAIPPEGRARGEIRTSAIEGFTKQWHEIGGTPGRLTSRP